jgi:hypothetical protein
MRKRAIWIRSVLVLALASGAVDCRRTRTPDGEREEAMTRRPIEEVLEDQTPALMALPGVTGTYQGALEDGRPCIKVMVTAPSPDLEARIPRELDGYPVLLEVTGEIRAMPGGDR